MTFKIMDKLCPENFSNNSSQDPRFRNIMHGIDEIYRYRDIRLNLQKKGFHYSALKAWNNLPAELRELPTQNSFKKQLKTYLKG